MSAECMFTVELTERELRALANVAGMWSGLLENVAEGDVLHLHCLECPDSPTRALSPLVSATMKLEALMIAEGVER